MRTFGKEMIGFSNLVSYDSPSRQNQNSKIMVGDAARN